jgi:serine/threonine-protein kinase
MRFKGPLVTLAAGAVLAVGLFAANLGNSSRTTGTASSAVAETSAPSAATSGTATAAVATTPPATSSAPALPAEATYAGKVNGGGSLAVAVKGASAVAYLCDGTNEAWLWGSVDGGSVSLKNKNGDQLTGSGGGGKLTGSLTVRGRNWSFALPTVTKPSGLYRSTAKVRGATVVGGWVVLPDGSQVGLVTAVGGVGRAAPAIDLATGAVTVDGQSLTAGPIDPAQPAP